MFLLEALSNCHSQLSDLCRLKALRAFRKLTSRSGLHQHILWFSCLTDELRRLRKLKASRNQSNTLVPIWAAVAFSGQTDRAVRLITHA